MSTPAAGASRVTSIAKGYSPLQIAIAGLLASAVVIGGVLLLNSVNATQYGVLYTNLSEQDASRVVEDLTARGVPFELTAGGTTVSVPVETVDQERLALAAAGLPATSIVGYEVLDGQTLTTSSFREQVNYQRALEGELARTLMSMDGVESASVRIVLPEERVFTADQRPASAAVVLTTLTPLSESQVQAVVHLVASSVPDLAPENVTVTDSTGQLLAGGPGNSGSGAAESMQSDVEMRLTVAADTMLFQVLGPDQAVVRVAADINRDEEMEQAEVFDPNRTAVGSTSTSTEEYSSTSTDTGGDVVTTQPNAAANQAAQSESETTYNSDSTVTENKVTRTITERKTPPGAINRLSVAVAVSDAAEVNPAQIEELVANAVGLDRARGDTIVVTQMPFAEVAQEPAPAPEPPGLMTQLPTILGGVVLVLVALALLLRMRSRRTPIDPAELAAAGASVAPAGQASVDTRTSRSEADRLLDRVDASPDEAAKVLRGWLAEDASRKR